MTGHSLRAAREHYENFPVLSRFVPPDLRSALARIYAFARATDDLGDEGPHDRRKRLEALRRWEGKLETALAARRPGITGRLASTNGQQACSIPPPIEEVVAAIRRHDLPEEAFRALVYANRLDQLRSRYRTYADLLEYCGCSANPVGRIVLALFGQRRASLLPASDAICTGLQLANHWQGIAEDLRYRDRVYVPLEDLQRFGVHEIDLARDRPTRAVRRMVGHLVDRTRVLLDSGASLPGQLEPGPASVVRLFLRGGFAILDEIERRERDVLRGGIRVPRGRALLLLIAETIEHDRARRRFERGGARLDSAASFAEGGGGHDHHLGSAAPWREG